MKSIIETFIEIITLYRNNFKELNNAMKQSTRIIQFFHDEAHIAHFLKYAESLKDQRATFYQSIATKKQKDDTGDFQTPLPFCKQICRFLKKKGIRPRIVIEPTCGFGNFVVAALEIFDSIEKVYCVELQKQYEFVFKTMLFEYYYQQPDPDNNNNQKPEIRYINTNIFELNFKQLCADDAGCFNGKEILILGNPPWVTNSELERMESENLPKKSNIKKFTGIESITGKSNFDIAEYIIMDLIGKFGAIERSDKESHPIQLAMLCKPIVARNLLYLNKDVALPFQDAELIEFDAKKEFGVSAPGCLFLCTIISDSQSSIIKIQSESNEINEQMEPIPSFWLTNSSKTAIVSRFKDDYSIELLKTIGWVNDRFVSNVEEYRSIKHLDGTFPFEWRQGIKHDLTDIMVLKPLDPEKNLYQNGFGQQVELEPDLLYPFLKSSEIRSTQLQASDTKKYVIITQQKVGADTSYLAEKYPLTFKYLNAHRSSFEHRKSKIYKNQPPFSIFGIGPYSFAPIKIAISGFYKTPVFCLLDALTNGTKPYMLDDTCYFIPFDRLDDALPVWKALNSDDCKRFLNSIVFSDSKRLYTKDILKRIAIQW